VKQTLWRLLGVWWVIGLICTIGLPAVFGPSRFVSLSTGQTCPVLQMGRLSAALGHSVGYVSVDQCIWYWSVTSLFWFSLVFLFFFCLPYALRRSRLRRRKTGRE
jgi:hypothetical protein